MRTRIDRSAVDTDKMRVASKAGLQFGDMITTINNQPIGTVDAVNTALSGLHPGDKVAISFTRLLMSYTTQATLAQRPPGYP